MIDKIKIFKDTYSKAHIETINKLNEIIDVVNKINNEFIQADGPDFTKPDTPKPERQCEHKWEPVLERCTKCGEDRK